MALQSINPATGETLATFHTLSPAEIAASLIARDRGASIWKDTPFDERARLLTCAPPTSSSESPGSSGG